MHDSSTRNTRETLCCRAWEFKNSQEEIKEQMRFFLGTKQLWFSLLAPGMGAALQGCAPVPIPGAKDTRIFVWTRKLLF